jgi:outer membrane protein OmpA-like peptidoglycan-associated protein
MMDYYHSEWKNSLCLSIEKDKSMRLLLILISIVLTSKLEAQLDFGEFNTPYAGVHALSFNPAEIVDSRYKFHMNLAGMGLSASNNFVGLSNKMMSFSPPTVDSASKYELFPQVLNGKAKNAYLQSHIMGPSFLYALGRNNKFSIGISTGVKLLGTMNNIDEELARYIYDNKRKEFWQNSFWSNTSSVDFMVNMSSWAYTGLTAGGVLLDSRKWTLKGAVTGKVNFGLFNSYMNSPNLYVNFNSSNQLYDINGVVKTQISTPIIENNKLASGAIKFNTNNAGFGVDAGFIIEKKDKGEYNYEFDCRFDNVRKDLNKYAYRFGVSVVDYGGINWQPKAALRYVFIDSSQYRFIMNTKTFEKAGLEPGPFIDSLKKYGFNGLAVDETVEKYYMATPSNLNVFFDLHLGDGLYLAVNGSYAFNANNFAASKTQNSRFTFTPRYESKLFGFYLPINYNMLAEEINAGFAMRLFFFNFALYDWTGIAGLKSQTKNFAMNMSINIPFHQRPHPKDNDHDLMSNKIDKCKNFAGDCNSDGCPEADDDGDGVKNSQDKCPSVKGPLKLDGCPDADEDGITDAQDRCPKQKGKLELGGCPDKDGDGVIDGNDRCPNDKGLIEFEGCPDTDHDKIPNNLDECPLDSGVFENKGCPEIKIVDTDNDGMEDNLDKCPTIYGPKSNNGCPIPKEVMDIAKVAQENLEFLTGSAVIKKESIESLTVLSGYLSRNPNVKVILSGHTDNVGKPEKNMKLSKDRAEAVKNFLLSHGVDSSRMTSDGFGDTKPIGDNNTPSGRAVNRRVDIELK